MDVCVFALTEGKTPFSFPEEELYFFQNNSYES
jgi:hypothetical protein